MCQDEFERNSFEIIQYVPGDGLETSRYNSRVANPIRSDHVIKVQGLLYLVCESTESGPLKVDWR